MGINTSTPQFANAMPRVGWRSVTAMTGLALLLLLLAGIKYTLNLEQILDVAFGDEGYYLYQGYNLWYRIFPGPTFGPAYSVWYFLLSILQPDRVALHYLNQRMIAIGLPIALFIALIRHRAALIPAFFAAFWLLIADVNIAVSPKINHFAVIVLLVSLALLANRSRLWQLNQLAFTTFLLSYVRPEMLTLSFIFLVLAIIDTARARRPLKTYAATAAIVLFMGLVFIVYGVATEGERSQIAMSQHFALNWVEWNQSDLFPWSNHEMIWQETFGDAKSVLQAAQNNPEQLLRHVLTNVQRLPQVAGELFFAHPSVVVAPEQYRVESIGLVVVLVVLLGITYRDWLPFVKTRVRQHGLLLGVLLLFILFSVAQGVVIYPREHYFVIPSTLILMVVVLLMSGDGTSRLPSLRIGALALVGAILLLFLIPSTFLFRGDYVGNGNYLTLQFLKSIPMTTPQRIKLLDPETGYYFYLDRTYQSIYPQAKNSNGDFNAFLAREDFALLVVSPLLRRDSRYKDDAEWLYFLDHPEEFGYIAMPVPDTFRVIYVAEKYYTP